MISFCITIGVLALLPNYFPKYTITLIKKGRNDLKNEVHDVDLNFDGKSEQFVFGENNIKNASYTYIAANGGVIDQYNFDTKFGVNKAYWFEDANNNGIQELYLLTKSNDSVFLNIHEHKEKRKIWKERIFVDTIEGYNQKNSFNGGIYNKLNKNRYQKNSVAFHITVGFGGAPRNIYSYHLPSNTISKSKHLTNVSEIWDFTDLNNDGKNDILLRTHSSGNAIDSVYTQRTDYSTWLMALDNSLAFLFEPIEIKSKGTVSSTFIQESNSTVLVFLYHSVDKKTPSKLLKVTTKGEILKERKLSSDKYKNLYKLNKNTLLINNVNQKAIELYDTNLMHINTKQLPIHPYLTRSLNLDLDAQNEWLIFDPLDNFIAIAENDFNHFTLKKVPQLNIIPQNFGFCYLDKNTKLFYIQFEKYVYYYEYAKNQYYYVKCLFYLVAYLFVLTLTFLILKGQKIRDQKKRAIEKEIADLQLKTIKNKVDPHFVFNAINTISEMSLMDDKLEIDRFISRFSNFMRGTLEHSDKISTTLKEEITYTENFIKLQQIRFNHQFEYSVSVDKNIDKSFKIPKHSIFTYVENALKYGLPSQEKGNLKIKIDKIKQQIVIQIQDNGAGFNQAIKKNHKGTGNGLKIMNKIFNLYENRYKTKIEHTVQELKNENEIKGVLVTIKITPNTKN